MRSPLAALAALLLAACAGAPPAASVTGRIVPVAGAVDNAAAAKAISDYRARHSLPPVKVSATLTRIAASHAQRMAATDRLEHVLGDEGSFMQRITDGGYVPSMAAENLGAGYHTLAAAMAGWQGSPAHNANLLNRDIAEIGIAYYTTPAGEYHQYWSLVMARPAPPPAASANGSPFGGFSFGGASGTRAN